MAKYAKLLLGCYRTGDANDPEVYTGAVIAVLADYPNDVIETVVDPRCGLPAKINWLPTIAEIKKACEEIEGPRRRMREWERGAQQLLAERETLMITDGRPRKTYAELQAELAEVGIFIGTKGGSMPKALNIQKFCTDHGVTKEQWDAMPNQGDKLLPGGRWIKPTTEVEEILPTAPASNVET